MFSSREPSLEKSRELRRTLIEESRGSMKMKRQNLIHQSVHPETVIFEDKLNKLYILAAWLSP